VCKVIHTLMIVVWFHTLFALHTSPQQRAAAVVINSQAPSSKVPHAEMEQTKDCQTWPKWQNGLWNQSHHRVFSVLFCINEAGISFVGIFDTFVYGASHVKSCALKRRGHSSDERARGRRDTDRTRGRRGKGKKSCARSTSAHQQQRLWCGLWRALSPQPSPQADRGL
jgi:hypothetical protein